MNNLKQLQQQWYNENAPIGKRCGYPDCCINEFCEQPPELLKKSKPTQTDIDRFKAGCIHGVFTGFIPCKDHAEKILRGEITLASLIQNYRDPRFPPFPHV